jgi:hypothetical protein
LEQQLHRKQREIVLAQEQLRQMASLSHSVNPKDLFFFFFIYLYDGLFLLGCS